MAQPIDTQQLIALSYFNSSLSVQMLKYSQRVINNLNRYKKMENRFVRVSLVVFFSIIVGACSAVTSAPTMMPELLGVDGVTVATTGKTISDHIVSYTSGKNCSTVRRSTGQNFCEEDDLSPPEEIYCYNSLGNVNCFATPQPYGQGNSTIDHISGKPGLIR
ncbi:MAG: hypothetical protein HN884_00740 [Rhodospirillaceae bacterium]|jgi:hypothetical protein|nr:hypothetical protein [Rhodospirillaceae bacterium]MBT7265373.1 hypothetical protein [Rhodospirillaceae bacterium]